MNISMSPTAPDTVLQGSPASPSCSPQVSPTLSPTIGLPQVVN